MPNHTATARTPPFQIRRVARLLAGSSAALMGLSLVVLPSASAVTSPVPADNPDLRPGCGLDVVLVLDASGSIGAAAPDVQNAARGLLTALSDTNSRVGIVQFSTKARQTAPMTVVTPTTATTGVLGAAVAAYRSNGWTNWEDAFLAARTTLSAPPTRSVPKLVVVITDGAPNTYNGYTGSGPLGDADPRAVAPAVVAMNSLKDDNGIRAHVLAIGVGKVNTGDRLELLGALQKVSGTDLVDYGTTPPSGTFDAKTTDIVLQPRISDVADSFKMLANQVCEGGLTVTRLVGSKDGPTTYRGNGPAFDVTTTVDPPGNWSLPDADIAGASKTVRTNVGGTSVFQWKPSTSAWHKTATISVTAQNNYVLQSASCSLNGRPALSRPVTGWSFSTTVGGSADPLGGAVACRAFLKWTGPLSSRVIVGITPRLLVYGVGRPVLAGSLRSPVGSVAASRVSIVSRDARGGRWSRPLFRTTDRAGRFTVRISATRSRVFVVTFPGATGRLYKTSTTVAAPVYARVSAKLSRSRVAVGSRVLVTGTVSPGRRGNKVTLQRLIGARWVNVKSTRLDQSRSFLLSMTPTKAWARTYRVVNTRGATTLAGSSRRMILVAVSQR